MSLNGLTSTRVSSHLLAQQGTRLERQTHLKPVCVVLHTSGRRLRDEVRD